MGFLAALPFALAGAGTGGGALGAVSAGAGALGAGAAAAGGAGISGLAASGGPSSFLSGVTQAASTISAGASLVNAFRPLPKLPTLQIPPAQPSFLGGARVGQNSSLSALPPTSALGGTGGNWSSPAGAGKTLLGS